jgi:hypothetical protein
MRKIEEKDAGRVQNCRKMKKRENEPNPIAVTASSHRKQQQLTNLTHSQNAQPHRELFLTTIPITQPTPRPQFHKSPHPLCLVHSKQPPFKSPLQIKITNIIIPNHPITTHCRA